MRAVFLVPALSLLMACGGGTSPTQPPSTDPPTDGTPTTQREIDTVFVSGVTFTPRTLTVDRNRTVVWVKSDATVFHTVTPQNHSEWQSVGSSGTGEILRVTFANAGTYAYFCLPHLPTMTGSVTVR